ncbi:hypothetical protein ACOMHN_003410 [Nucella lapillus]
MIRLLPELPQLGTLVFCRCHFGIFHLPYLLPKVGTIAPNHSGLYLPYRRCWFLPLALRGQGKAHADNSEQTASRWGVDDLVQTDGGSLRHPIQPPAPNLVSPVPDPLAWATDALSIPWRGILGYAYPPFPLLPKVLRKARLEQAELLLSPRWPAQPWFSDLLTLTSYPPIQLTPRRDLLRQPRSGICHPNPSLLHLHAWRLGRTDGL